MYFAVRVTEAMKSEHADFMETQRKELLAGKITIRWHQGRGGYVIFSGRSPVLGVESFMWKSQAKEWLKENHNIEI